MMRKKIGCMLLTAAMLVILCPVNALAYSNIDLSRVKFSSGSEPLVFEFGEVKLEGKVRQIYPFTEAEIDKLIQQALKEAGLTELDIKEAGDKVEKARRASDFTQEDIDRIKQNFLTSMGTVPAAGNAATLLQVIDTYMNSSSWDDIGTASADLLEQSMSAQVKETASGFVDRAGQLGENVNLANQWTGTLTSIVSFCDMLADAQAHDRQKWQDIANGAEAKRLLNCFYEALQDEIDRYKQKSDKAGWTIDFNQAMARRCFTFFGAGNNYQTWYLDMNLEQKSTNEFGNIAGEYEGNYTLRAEHDMSEGFQQQSDAVLRDLNSKGTLGAGLPVFINQMRTAGFPTDFKPGAAGTVYISRTISGSCEATIAESGEITLSLHEAQDETTVNISGVTAELTSVIQQSGVNAKMVTTCELSADKEELTVRMKTTETSGSAAGYGFGYLQDLKGWSKAGWDENIWKPWDGTQKTLKLA